MGLCQNSNKIRVVPGNIGNGIFEPVKNFQRLFGLGILLLNLIVCGCSKDKSTNPDDNITTNRYLIVAEEGDLFSVDIIDKSSFRLTYDAKVIADYNAQFSADGQNIIWQRHENIAEKSSYEVWIMDTNGENKNKIANGVISPIDACSMNNEIILIDTMNTLRIYNLSGIYIGYLAADGGYKYIPQWSPDGNKIAYITKGDFFGEPTPEENPNIIIYNRDGSGRQDLTNTSETEIFFRWTDNENIAIVRDTRTLNVKNINTGNEIQLDDLIARPDFNFYRVYLDCSLDGSTIFYTDNDLQLYSVLIADGTRQNISAGGASYVNESSISSEGTKIAYSSGTSIHVSDIDGGNKDIVYTPSLYYNYVYAEDFY